MSLENITDNIIQAASASIPKSSGKTGKRNQIWWNQQTEMAVKKRRKALRTLRKLQIDDPNKEAARLEYIEVNKETRKIITNARQSSWEKFAEIFNANANSSELWQSYNKLAKKKHTGAHSIVIDGKQTNDPQEIAERFADFFVSTSCTANYSEEFQQLKRNREEINLDCNFKETSPLDKEFSINELLRALDNTKGSSTGPDNIGYPMLRRLPLHCKYTLLKAFNNIWANGVIPDKWKQSIVIPIPKSGKNSNEIDKFRPISLTSCMAKTFERMVNRRLTTHLETNGILHPNQFAFRRGMGTSDYLSELDHVITEAAKRGEHSEIVTLDIKKAYDRVWHRHVMDTIISNHMGKHMTQYINNFLTERYFQVSFGGSLSQTKTQENGVPQGSVLSVTLFLLAINPIFNATPKNVQCYSKEMVISLFKANPDQNPPQ